KKNEYVFLKHSDFWSDRYASYRQFTWWVHGRLGRRIHRLIPSCAVSKIRNIYSEPNGIYTGCVHENTNFLTRI
uniref:P2X purinoreceptor 7 intracellular domain-containing protein n=1 Tax=Seriola lalandi dorsalis TaxID=1841481 RepID=A0A3B4WFR9_SERLL